MLKWNPTDALTVLEVEPVVAEHEVSHADRVAKDGMRLGLTVFQYAGDVHIRCSTNALSGLSSNAVLSIAMRAGVLQTNVESSWSSRAGACSVAGMMKSRSFRTGFESA